MSEHFVVSPPRAARLLTELKDISVGNVDQAFEVTIRWLSKDDQLPSMSQVSFARISGCLKKHFGLTRLFRVGSHENGTRALGSSGGDFFAVLDCADTRSNSDRWLAAAARALSRDFGTPSGIRADRYAVLLSLGGGRERVRIVPALYVDIGPTGRPIYAIPDGAGRWQLASPEAHAEWLDEVNALRAGKLKAIIRLMKLWRIQQEIELDSYYCEILVTSFFNRNPIGSYGYSLGCLLLAMKASGLKAVAKGGGIPDLVDAASSREARIVSLSKIDKACAWACQSTLQERYGNMPAAMEGWGSVFGGSFPQFGHAMRPAEA